jgi:hypothetical protein
MDERIYMEEIEEDVITKLDHAIALLRQLKPVEMYVFVSRCEQYQKRISDLSKNAHDLILDSIVYPHRARKNTKSLVSILPKAIAIQQKVTRFVQSVDEYRRTAKPETKSPDRYPRGRSMEKKGRSQDKRSRSKPREIRGLSPLPPEILPQQ